jgi:hypothetical protein
MLCEICQLTKEKERKAREDGELKEEREVRGER